MITREEFWRSPLGIIIIGMAIGLVVVLILRLIIRTARRSAAPPRSAVPFAKAAPRSSPHGAKDMNFPE